MIKQRVNCTRDSLKSTKTPQFLPQRGCLSSRMLSSLSRSVPQSWAKTLKLPKSKFPPRASPTDWNKYTLRCTDDLYAWQRRQRPAENTFVLHDGPPYANGGLHIGHALNKVLKDIINRVQLGRGKQVQFVPGWDCHGLPIELKALGAMKDRKVWDNSKPVSAAMIRDAARKLAQETVHKQLEEFRKFGVMADWENRWTTMDKGFEKRQLSIFREMVDHGLIYRRFKPVYWSPTTRTALAEAELEYKDDHVSWATLVKFPLVKIPPHLARDPLLQVDRISAVIWTTTPWTLPANGAIAVNETLEYCIVKTDSHGYLLVEQSRLKYLEHEIKEDLSVIIPKIRGSELAGQTTYRPLFRGADAETQPIIAADFVTSESGSGLVHCAPGHGMEDYEACLAHGISAFAPVDEHGQFTVQAMPSSPSLLSGQNVLTDGNNSILRWLRLHGHLISGHRYEHRYPYDWRSKQPIIIRATEQWFADVGDIRGTAVKALEDVRFTPESGEQRLENFVKNRSEWCISRQRAWGVPIPALYHRGSGEAVLTKDSVSHIMSVIDSRGIDAWWTDDADDQAWIPPSLQETGPYRRGTDTMDVWFDSGTSWSGIGPARPEGYPADVYIEGTDQHRGWFQSSLLTFVAHQLATKKSPARSPFRHLITHGFTLDEDSRKMSKSLGNVVGPGAIMDGTLLPPVQRKGKKGGGAAHDALGPDALRMWVASSDYTRDVVISKQVLQTVHTSLHKYRMTFKLLLGALSDFHPDRLIPYGQLQRIDRIALMHLYNLVASCQTAYDNFEFYKAVNATNRWANLEFSAFYMETIKDRLYTLKEDGTNRRAAQTTLFYIYSYLQEVLGPITPLLVEETWEHAPEAIRTRGEHPLKRVVSTPPPEWQDPALEQDHQELMPVHSAINSAQEKGRNAKQIGSSLQSFVHIALPDGAIESSVFHRYLDELPDLFVVSSVSLSPHGESLPEAVGTAEWQHVEEFELPDGRRGTVYVYAPQDEKCNRCWRYVVPQAEDRSICGRCEEVVQDFEARPSQ